MPKVESLHFDCRQNQNNLSALGRPVLLDTLAQLSTTTQKTLVDNKLQNSNYSKESLQKRARSKAFTRSYLFDLINLQSSLKKSYWKTYDCSSVILQDDNKISSRYCNQRWCLVCNRIRTAKIISGYKSEIDKFSEPHFLTLTIPNVKEEDLPTAIVSMNKTIRDITKNAKKTYNTRIKALKKYECTYNNNTDEYHPHFHLIVNDKTTGELIRREWVKVYSKISVTNKELDEMYLSLEKEIKTYKTNNPKKKVPYLTLSADMQEKRKALKIEIQGQDLQPTDETSLIELCKYFTKVIAKDTDYNPKALDTMFKAVKNKRTFQPIGIKKQVSEEVEDIQEQEIDFKAPAIEIYTYEKDVYDWVSSSGECLSEYIPTAEDLRVINQEYKKPPKAYFNIVKNT